MRDGDAVEIPHLGKHRLRGLRDQLVQHRALGFTAPIVGARLFGRAGCSFVQTAREHPRLVGANLRAFIELAAARRWSFVDL